MFKATDPTDIELKLYISVVAVFGVAAVWQLAIHMPSLEDIVILLWHGIWKIAKTLSLLFLSIRNKTISANKKVGYKIEKIKGYLKVKFHFVVVYIRDHITKAPPHGRTVV